MLSETVLQRQLVDGPGQHVAVPDGRYVTLPGRGRTFVRELPGPPDAPTLLLVHGWLASSGMNWYRVFEPLAPEFRVVAPDLRGHGRGIRSSAPFSLVDCADDLAALIDVLDCGPVIAVAYSLGGPVTQLLWRRHPHTVAGLVQCSTTHRMAPGRGAQFVFGELLNYVAGVIRLSSAVNVWSNRGRKRPSPPPRLPSSPSSVRGWIVSEAQRHDVRLVLEAATAGTRFDSTPWIGEIDVPTAFVATIRDRAVSIDAQRETAQAIRGASLYEFDDDHLALSNPDYADVLLEACRDVANRVAGA